MILKEHERTMNFWKPIIEQYYNGMLPIAEIKKKKDFAGKKIIWQYWGQGIGTGEIPEIVRICFASVNRYKGDYEVIRIVDDTITDYVEFPDEVIKKLKNGIFTRTAFSDLLRLALLNLYGGVWLDATILLTGELPCRYAPMDYFMFQRSPQVENKKLWENIYAYYWGWYPGFRVNMLSSVIFSHPDNKVISDLCYMLLYVWMSYSEYPHYFAFQILYDTLINGYLREHKCQVESDTIPHLLQMKLNNHAISCSMAEIMHLTTIHKMCYFDDAALSRVKEFIVDHVNALMDDA